MPKILSFSKAFYYFSLMNTPQIINILEEIELLIEESEQPVVIADTIYESVDELLDDINDFIVQLEEGNLDTIEYLDIHFLKNATFHTLAVQNGWEQSYASWALAYEAAKQSV